MFDGPLTAELDPGERRARLRLARSARIGPVTFHEALAHFGSAHAACARLNTIGDAVIAREEDALAKAGGRFLVFGDPAYPPALAVIAEASLSYLGVGMPATQPSLGTLIRIGNAFLFSGEWWIVLFPVFALVILSLAVNILGDWLRDALNPKLR